MMKTHCGYIAIVGRPNVGKSTLLNYILGEKLSVTSRKPQTTRDKILGIKTENNVQAIYLDTPGLHQGIKKTANRNMNKTSFSALSDVDVIVFVISGLEWENDDDWILRRLKKTDVPIILAINKVDTIKNKDKLLPYLQELSTKTEIVHLVPISATKGTNIDNLEKTIAALLPENDFFYPEEQLTDRGDSFLAAELIREKIMRQLGEEVPYVVTVEIEKFEKENDILNIAAVIYVEREGQKAIIIGSNGEQLKSISKSARIDMEKLFDCKVFLRCWVRLRGT